MILLLTDEAKEDLADYWSFIYTNAQQNGQDPQKAADHAIDRFLSAPEISRHFQNRGDCVKSLAQEFAAYRFVDTCFFIKFVQKMF